MLTMIGPADIMHPINDVMKMGHYLSGLPRKANNPSAILMKTLIERHSMTLISTLQKCQGHQKQEKI